VAPTSPLIQLYLSRISGPLLDRIDLHMLSQSILGPTKAENNRAAQKIQEHLAF
jgi:predicted ATPase with chaperone activity